MTELVMLGLVLIVAGGVALFALKIVLILILWFVASLGAAWRGQL